MSDIYLKMLTVMCSLLLSSLLLLLLAGVMPLEVKNNWKPSLSAAISVQPTSGHTIYQLRGIYGLDRGKNIVASSVK
jgi:hypothetical protein